MKTTILITIVVTLSVSSIALAHKTSPNPMAHGGMAGMESGMMNDPSNPYAKSEMDMHIKMMSVRTGDASEKWTRKMIEHHRGALSMSRVALTAATDADIKAMAQMTITMQENDIAKLQGWLKDHGKAAQ